MKTEILFQDPFFFSNSANTGIKNRRQIMSVLLVFSDAIAIAASFLVAIFIWKQVRADINIEAHLTIIPYIIMFFILSYQSMAHYPGIGIGPVQELKKTSTSASIVFFVMIALSFFLRNSTIFSRAVMVISWVIILVSIPLTRKLFRRLALQMGVWGIPVAIVGKADNVTRIQQRLSMHPLGGFWPVLCISGQLKNIFPATKKSDHLFSRISTLIVITDGGNFDSIHHLLTQNLYQFKQTILIFDEAKIGPVWFTLINIAENVGFEVANNLLNRGYKISKRIVEIALIILSSPLSLIFFVLITIAIKLNSPGPVFYKQKRIGYDGKELWVLKFRTMQQNADKIITQYLANNPAYRAEWEENFKLREDPRITSLGKILRQTSFDELPQIWNVLKGEMSLVGPRPIVQNEIPLYGEYFEIYKQVKPGITGLWQISGRNDLPYQERVLLDVYYIQNWSVWLDIHILMHTFLAVIQRRGAY